MEQTKNYKLNKPGQDDFYNVEDFNQNADILDQALKELAEGDSDQYVSKTGDTMTGDWNFTDRFMNTTIKHKLIIGNNDSGYASIYAHDSDGGYSDPGVNAKRLVLGGSEIMASGGTFTTYPTQKKQPMPPPKNT